MLNASQAATTPDPIEVLKAQSYGDLLEPIPKRDGYAKNGR
jgi:hypothetical protein